MLKTKDIVFICDDNYCLPTAVCVKSIIDNIGDDINDLIIHVSTFGLNEENITLINNLSTQSVKVEVNTFDVTKYKDRLNGITQRSHVTPSALIKFELANYYKDIDSILYMDSDMVVKGDISELLHLDLESFYVAASYEFWNHINRISYSLLRTVSKEFYFNSGVMLLNLKKMREDNVPESLWFYKLNRAKTTLMDQESLNAICATKSLHLSIKWNFNPLFMRKAYLKEINRVYRTHYDSLRDLEEDICIVHYVGSTDKPWKYLNANMRKFWDIIYERLYDRKLQLIEPEIVTRSRVEAIKDKINKHGFLGFICNIFYLISLKIEKD